VARVDSGDQAEERKSVVALGQYFNLGQIEQEALRLLREYVQKNSLTTVPQPIPVDRIADMLDLGVLWEPISETKGQVILAKLVPQEQLIIFNEARETLFSQTEFLFNTTLAHEIGHWILHMERGNWGNQMPLFEVTGPKQEIFVYRSSGSSRSSWDEKNAHRFMGCLLLPKHLLTEAVAQAPLTSLADLYELRDRFEVTVTALSIRLAELNIAYIDTNGRVYANREAFEGQATLW
jgi:Zn-dependent peptidase ImmA (M78 family)